MKTTKSNAETKAKSPVKTRGSKKVKTKEANTPTEPKIDENPEFSIVFNHRGEFVNDNNRVGVMLRIAIYVDHSVVDDGSGCDSDDDEGVKFNNSEDERAMGLDDGFGVDTNDEPSNENNMRLVLSSIGVSGSESKFEDDEYESEELGSSDPDASDEERGRKPPKAKAPDEAKSGAIPKSDANPSIEANASQQPNSTTIEVSQVDNPTQNSASVQADHSASVQADQEPLRWKY
ncbi:hypothetical protein QL285_013772 [Trifolium repens]|nr:hypothetical protein QL285_013772 [Trifolium repens]